MAYSWLISTINRAINHYQWLMGCLNLIKNGLGGCTANYKWEETFLGSGHLGFLVKTRKDDGVQAAWQGPFFVFFVRNNVPGISGHVFGDFGVQH